MQSVKTGVILGAGMIARTHMLACAAARHKVRLKGIGDGGSGRAGALALEACRLLGHDVLHFKSVDEIATGFIASTRFLD
ncbi:hypothetical protein C5748_09545 [Phyllobacterium phragmitis]|uniref:Gfo/Idh/MocA-like oxidoreductase N-terminal domain-containing protein n=1 Tax=Phyllobacterium phragmitis TaxID=2670329 RepID=A0A2S9ISM2_9HYPH|nr:hypothetical protein C5748_09545 [Phyllobacterium phragmitis]